MATLRDPTNACSYRTSEGKSLDFSNLFLLIIQAPLWSWLLLDTTALISRALYTTLGLPVLLSLCLRSSILDITGKTLCLTEACPTVVLILADSQKSVRGGSADSSQPPPSHLPHPIVLPLSLHDDGPVFFHVTALHLVHCLGVSLSCRTRPSDQNSALLLVFKCLLARV